MARAQARPPLRAPPRSRGGCARACFSACRAAALAAALFVAAYALPRAAGEWLELRAGAAAYAAALSQAPALSPSSALPVLLPLCARGPARGGYLAASLASLRAAAAAADAAAGGGVARSTVLVVSDDCGDAGAAAAVAAAAGWARVVRLAHSPPWLGAHALVSPRSDAAVAANVRFLLRFAFEWAAAPAAVVLEEDVELAPDALLYFRWALARAAADARLAPRLLTVNGYYAGGGGGGGVGVGGGGGGAPPLFDVATDEAGFMVWGWALPASSWPVLRAGWTWLDNWDFACERTRAARGAVSLSPLVSRTRHIGMRGGNFAVTDAAEARAWTQHPIAAGPAADYAGQPMRVWRTAAERGAQSAGK